MSKICKTLKDLSKHGYWDDIFNCLNIDANSTIELGNLKIPEQQHDLWLDDHRATLNSLEVILGFILLCDQIFYILLLLYLSLFAVKLFRLHLFYIFQRWLTKAKIALKKYQYKKQAEIMLNRRHAKYTYQNNLNINK